MTFKDLHAESYELSTILQHDTTYKLIHFLARLQVTTTSHMAYEHTEQQMVEHALVNKLESDDELKLQNIGRRHVIKKCRARINLLELNMALVEVFPICFPLVAPLSNPSFPPLSLLFPLFSCFSTLPLLDC